MNFSSISGILLTIAALVWVGLILPVWSRSNENRTDRRTVPQTTALSGQNSPQMQKLDRASKLGALLFLTAAISVFVAFLTGTLWLFAAGLTVAIPATLLQLKVRNRRVKIRNVAKTQKSGILKKNIGKYLSETQLTPKAEPIGWKPVEVPAPMHHLNKNGSLEQPSLAEVTNIEENQVRSTEAIDEILRRRRAV